MQAREHNTSWILCCSLPKLYRTNPMCACVRACVLGHVRMHGNIRPHRVFGKWCPCDDQCKIAPAALFACGTYQILDPTSAPRLRHICAGTVPHLRRDCATSAPGLRHICAGTFTRRAVRQSSLWRFLLCTAPAGRFRSPAAGMVSASPIRPERLTSALAALGLASALAALGLASALAALGLASALAAVGLGGDQGFCCMSVGREDSRIGESAARLSHTTRLSAGKQDGSISRAVVGTAGFDAKGDNRGGVTGLYAARVAGGDGIVGWNAAAERAAGRARKPSSGACSAKEPRSGACSARTTCSGLFRNSAPLQDDKKLRRERMAVRVLPCPVCARART